MKGLICGLRGLSFGPERAHSGSERADLGPERGIGGNGQPDGQTDIWMDVWKFTPVSYRTSALWGRCPKRCQYTF